MGTIENASAMDKQIKTVVPESQQQIVTQVERDEGELEIEIIACSALDDELRSEFHDEIQALETESVSVRSHRYKSHQGNELRQEVFLRFDTDDLLDGVDVTDAVIQIGKEYYDRQLERNLGRDEESASKTRYGNQQRYFDDEIVKEFCLLYRGGVSF